MVQTARAVCTSMQQNTPTSMVSGNEWQLGLEGFAEQGATKDCLVQMKQYLYYTYKKDHTLSNASEVSGKKRIFSLFGLNMFCFRK